MVKKGDGAIYKERTEDLFAKEKKKDLQNSSQ